MHDKQFQRDCFRLLLPLVFIGGFGRVRVEDAGIMLLEDRQKKAFCLGWYLLVDMAGSEPGKCGFTAETQRKQQKLRHQDVQPDYDVVESTCFEEYKGRNTRYLVFSAILRLCGE